MVIGVLPHLLEKARADASPNVEILPSMEQQVLLNYYQRAKVYCQPSYTEGLPNSICEAMLCECVSVGTQVGGIPSAIGDCGFLVPYGEVGLLVEAIRSALHAPESLGQRGRARIAEHFPLKKREETLLRIIQEAVR